MATTVHVHDHVNVNVFVNVYVDVDVIVDVNVNVNGSSHAKTLSRRAGIFGLVLWFINSATNAAPAGREELSRG